MSMLRQRVLTALVLAPLVILAILLAPGALFAFIAGASFLAAMWEWTRLSGLQSPVSQGAVLVVSTLLLLMLWWLRATIMWPAALVAGVLWWFVACAWLRHFAFGAAPTAENRNLKLLAGMFVIVPAWVAFCTIHARELHGNWWALLALVIVWAADIGAYFSGRYFGKRKLAPQISPGKTWAGVYGAVLAGTLVATISGWLLGVHDGRLIGLGVLAVITIAVSIVGDLLESLMKRHASVKDSGTLFPGHGGLLDRLDSVFAALPIFAFGMLLIGL